ncbi:MAG: SufD family Fe-S cluster assembly protein [Burkholderiales bacterium]|nr:SufD family Fe-S cluster assembly protein [Burkholderiales bacterium]
MAVDTATGDALAARHTLATGGWIARKSESFRHLPPPAVDVWLGGESEHATLAHEDGWQLATVSGTPLDAVIAQRLDATDPAERATLLAGCDVVEGDEAAAFVWAHRALLRRGLRLAIGAGESFVRLDRVALCRVEAPLLVLDVAEGAHCVLHEAHALAHAAATVQNLHVHIRLARGARLQHLRHVPAAADGQIAHHVHVTLAEDAHYAQALLAVGGRYHLQRHVVRLEGARAAARIDGVLLASGQDAIEQQVLSHHRAAHTKSGAEVLALAAGASRVVGNAWTQIAERCDEADARQKLVGIPVSGHPRLVLRPHLEIHHDQVQAAHGATVGSLPEEAIFFARQRGLDASAAKALILTGMARAALSRGVDDEALPDMLRLDAALADAVGSHLAIGEDAHG